MVSAVWRLQTTCSGALLLFKASLPGTVLASAFPPPSLDFFGTTELLSWTFIFFEVSLDFFDNADLRSLILLFMASLGFCSEGDLLSLALLWVVQVSPMSDQPTLAFLFFFSLAAKFLKVLALAWKHLDETRWLQTPKDWQGCFSATAILVQKQRPRGWVVNHAHWAPPFFGRS